MYHQWHFQLITSFLFSLTGVVHGRCLGYWTGYHGKESGSFERCVPWVLCCAACRIVLLLEVGFGPLQLHKASFEPEQAGLRSSTYYSSWHLLKHIYIYMFCRHWCLPTEQPLALHKLTSSDLSELRHLVVILLMLPYCCFDCLYFSPLL